MSKLTKNVVYNLLGQGLLLAVGLIAIKYVFRELGADALGIIYFTQTMSTMLYAVLEMGLGSTTIREVSSHFHEEPAYMRDFVRTGSLLFWLAYGLLALAVYAIAPLLVQKWIHLQNMDASVATHVFRILGIASVSILPRSFYASILRGLQRFGLTNLIDVAFSTLQQFGTIVILLGGGRLVHVAWWLAACLALVVGGYLAASSQLVSWRALVPGFSLAVIRRNLAYASRMASITLTSTVHTQADRAITSKLLPVSTFGYYAIAYGAVAKSQLLTGAVAQAAFPSLSALFKAGDWETLMSQYRKVHDLICFATVPLFAAVPFAAVPVFAFALNTEAAHALLLPTSLLCLGFYMNGTLTAPYVVSLAIDKPGITARSNIYALFVVLPITFLLIYFLGIIGAGLSWVVYHLFAYAYAARRICFECLQMPFWHWCWHILKILGLTAATYGAAWLIVHVVRASSLLGLATGYGVGTILFLLGAFWMIGESLRESVLHSWQVLRLKVAEAL